MDRRNAVMPTPAHGAADGRPTEPPPWSSASPEQLAQRYYDATTWIYRWAWGASFHFAPLRRAESRRDAIRRYEEVVAHALGLRPGMTCLDVGCGVGGPAATIAAATGARVVGIGSSLGQLRQMRRDHRSLASPRPVAAEFDRLPVRTATLDRAYAFEALCHAVDLESALREVYRVLRPGGMLALSEWCLTERFDPRDEAHVALQRTIESAYGVARLRGVPEWRACLQHAGFAIVECVDRAGADAAADAEPWYRGLQPRDRSLDSIGRRPGLRMLAALGLAVAERCRLAPAGTSAAVRELRRGTAALVDAGTRGIFTPMRFMLASKHVDAA